MDQNTDDEQEPGPFGFNEYWSSVAEEYGVPQTEAEFKAVMQVCWSTARQCFFNEIARVQIESTNRDLETANV